MKKIILSVTCLIATGGANAQSPAFEWAKNMGGYKAIVTGKSIVTDASGNVFTTGYFSGKADFDPGAGVFYLTSSVGYDVFILKTDASGNFVWAKQLGGSLDDQGFSIALDAAGNIYTTGYFQGTADFDPGAAALNLTSAGSNDIFISKLNASGNFVWAKQVGGTLNDQGFSIAINASGNVYTTGYFQGTADFDPDVSGTFNLTSAGSNDIFISKLNASGNFVWAKQMGGSSTDVGNSVALDASGNVYTTGTFQGTADFNPGAGIYNFTSAGSDDIFISKLDVSGNFIWAQQIGGSSPDAGYSLALDASGNIYATGYFQETADFDPGAGIFNLTADGLSDIFILKLNSNGNFLWAKQMRGTLDEAANSIALDGSGNIYTTGNFWGTVDFDPGAATFNLTAAVNYSNIFISKLDSSGNFVWAKDIWTTTKEVVNAVASDASGNVYTTGNFVGTVNFNPAGGPFTSFNLGLNPGIFISKLNTSGNFLWVNTMGGSTSTWGTSIAVDLSGNVYTTGYFNGTADFDPGTGIFNLTNTNDEYLDIFISKLDPSGNFVWAKQIGGTKDNRGLSIAVDGSGNVYTTGYFFGTADFDPGAGIFNLTSSGHNDIFISKLNASGNFVWAKQIGGTSGSQGTSLTVDGSGNVYITGTFGGTIDFDPDVSGTYNLTASGSSDIFISKLNVSGNFVWAKQMGGKSNDSGFSIALDASGNVYTTGIFRDTADFDPDVSGTFNLTSVGTYDVFISKLDASGNFIWARSMGGISTDEGVSIAVDVSGNVYTTGFFYGVADFDPGAGTFNLSSFTGGAAFILKLSASGNFVWARNLGHGINSNSGLQIKSIALDASGNVYTAGSFGGTVDLDPGAATFNLATSSYPDADIFILKLDFSGNFVWAKQIGGSTSIDQGICIAINASDNIYTTGYFSGIADFDPGAGTAYINSSGDPDIFVHKMSQCTLPSAVITPSGSTTFCSGGNVVLNAVVATNRTYQWKKNNTNISGATLSSYTATATGNYKVTVTNTQSGCSKTTVVATVVTVNAKPAATITPQGPTTFCAGGSVVLAANTGTGLTYKWKKNNNFIPGATLLSYTATTAGTYKVEITNSNGCSKLSPLVTVTVPCKFGESESVQMDSFGESAFDVKIFPNPNSGEFTITFSHELSSPVQIELTDDLGKVVRTFETINETVVIKESNLAKGIYILKIRQESKETRKKIVLE